MRYNLPAITFSSFNSVISFFFFFLISCSFSSPSGTSMMQMLDLLRLSQRVLILPSLFGFFFRLVLIGCFWLPYVPYHWFDSRLHPLVSCKLFCISISESFVSNWIIFMLLRSSLSSLSILITRVLNSASHRLLISIWFSSFSGVLICSFIWAMFLCLLILAASLCLFLCIR